MTLRRICSAIGLAYPPSVSRLDPTSTNGGFSGHGGQQIDATGEKIACIGSVVWADGSASKTMDSTSKVHFRLGNTTMADAGTTVRIGLQDLLMSGVTMAQPDGTFDVYREFAGNSGVITSADDGIVKTITLSTSGSKTVNAGDKIAVVFDMVSRGGTDLMYICTQPGAINRSYAQMPIQNLYTTSWGESYSYPMVLLEASDGTLGTFIGCCFLLAGSSYTFTTASSPNEYGLRFRVPYRCLINGFTACTSWNLDTDDGTFSLFQDPTTSPILLASMNIEGAWGNNRSDERYNSYSFSSEVELRPNIDYALTLRATGSSNCDLGYVQLESAAHQEINGMYSCGQVNRSGGSGAFSDGGSTIIPAIYLNIVAIDDGSPDAAFVLGVQ